MIHHYFKKCHLFALPNILQNEQQILFGIHKGAGQINISHEPDKILERVCQKKER